MTRVAAFVDACVRRWTRIYTWRLRPTVRDARYEEIESDLWESANDPDMTEAELTMQMVMRLTLGIADDVAWRLAQVRLAKSLMLGTGPAAAIVSVLLLLAAVAPLATNVPDLPAPPIIVRQAQAVLPAPPPPPPPPGAVSPSEPIFQYGRTSYTVATDGPRPVAIKEVQPIYPPVAVAAGLEGQVFVRARINEAGRVTDAEVAPDGVLGQSAMHAIRQWEFAAAANATLHPALLTVRVSFGRSQ
jgi:TonB family protein